MNKSWMRAEMRRREESIQKSARSIKEPQYNSALADRAQRRMLRVDAMPVEIRALVYEYGLEIVQEFLAHRVTQPKSIKHLIDTVRGTPYANGQARFKINKGPGTKRNPAEEEEEYYVIAERR